MDRKWYLYNMKAKILGRGSSEIANLLTGKTKPEYNPSMDCGDFVVVINSSKLTVTGDKMNKKIYTRYSGYPGGLKKETLKDIFSQSPQKVVRKAVYGMLPDNKLKDKIIKRLYIYPNEEHPYKEQLTNKPH